MIFYIITALYLVIISVFLIGLHYPNKKICDKKYNVSVVVAARNEEKNIGNILDDLVNQTYPKNLYEILIADDGSEDSTGTIIDNYARNYQNVRHIWAEVDQSTGLTAKKNALNQGISASSGDLILSADADCRVKPGWIETMVSYFTEETGMVVGFSQIGKPGTKYSLFEGLQALDFLSLMGAAQGSINWGCPLAASGQNLAYRKQAFEDIKGFELIKDRISGDDVLLLQLIYKLTNWKIRFAPSDKAFNFTLPEKSAKSFLNQRKRWASNGSYQLKLNKIFFFFISVMFLINAVLVLGTPIYYFLFHSITPPLICLTAKLFIEFLITFKAVKIYRRKDLLKYFPLWMIVQIPYVVFTGILGSFGHFKWKDRTHNQELTIFRTEL